MPKITKALSNNLNTNKLQIGGDNPKISIVMPAYNASRYIAKTIQSILQQDFENFELIIADDCSTDNTVEIISSFNDQRIRLIHTERNTGSAKYPRELAIEQSSAPYICWIDSDDIVDKNYLSSLLATKLSTGANIVCSRMLAERNGQLQYTLPSNLFDYNMVISGCEAVMMTLDHSWQINLNGWLCDKDLWTNITTFKSDKINHMDADDFSAREILFNANSVAFNQVNYHYRLHPDAITKKISAKKFESVITDRLVLEYFTDKYPKAIPIIQRSLCYRMISLMRIFAIHRNDLTYDDRLYSKNLLHQYFNKIRISDIFKANIPINFKMLLLIPFSFSLNIIKIRN